MLRRLATSRPMQDPMKVVVLPAALLAALALPAVGQIQLVQMAPAEIGTSMPLRVTGATPNATIFLAGSVRLGPPAGRGCSTWSSGRPRGWARSAPASIAVGHPGGSPMFISGAGAFLLSE